MLRAFIAIEIPEQIVAKIAAQTAELRRAVGHSVRWVAATNFHLTLKFLGDIASSQVEPLARALEAETRKHPPFEIGVGGFGAFPNLRRPRILWVGVLAPSILGTLTHQIDQILQPLGQSAESKKFSPHLTVGRVRESVSPAEAQTLGRALQDLQIGQLGTFAARSIHLFHSELQQGGPVYTRLFTSALGGQLSHEVKPESA